jgi:hypothetical protein
MTRIFLIHILALLIPFSTQQYDFDFSQLEGNSLFTDMMNCANHEDVSTCPSVTMKSGYYQCCGFRMSIQYYDYDSGRYESPISLDKCNIWFASDYSDEQIESMQKSYQEAVTFLTLNYKYYIPIIQNTYTCPKKTFTFNYGKGSFTDDEIAIMKDENYCLRLYYEGLHQLGYISNIIGDSSDRTITKDICMKGRTLPSSGNSCAYASFHFKFSDGTTEDIATCVLVSSASYESKSLDKLLEEDFKKFSSLDGEAVTSFDVEITNKDGNVLKYDSLTKTVVTEQNSSEKLEKSLLILFSLLIILL